MKLTINIIDYIIELNLNYLINKFLLNKDYAFFFADYYILYISMKLSPVKSTHNSSLEIIMVHKISIFFLF